MSRVDFVETFNLGEISPSSSTDGLEIRLSRVLALTEETKQELTTAIVQYPADFSFEISLAPIPGGQLAFLWLSRNERGGKETTRLAVLLQLVYIQDAINVLHYRSVAAVLPSCTCLLTSSPKSSVLAMVKDGLFGFPVLMNAEPAGKESTRI